MSYSRKVERLLESKRPSLSILLEDMSPDDKKGLKKEKNDSKKEPKKPEPASKSSSSSKPKKDKEEEFDFGNFDFEDESKDEEKEETKVDDKEKDEEDDEDKEKDDKEIEKIKNDIEEKFKKVYAGLDDPFTYDEITDKIFEGIFKKVGLSNSFRIQEKKIFLTNKKILKEFSVNDKVGDIDLSVELLVDNAINLTKNFEDLIDIPNLILTQVSAKFAEKAVDEEDENAGSEYRVKLEEFIEKYMQKLKTLDNYKNYDTSKYVISHNPQRPVATGARPST